MELWGNANISIGSCFNEEATRTIPTKIYNKPMQLRENRKAEGARTPK